ncbi:hypothetical protein KR222_009372, partial [Zaprionus bogoriensis]
RNANNHFDEHFHNLPIEESPNPYQNHNLNAIVWLRSLERQQHLRREAIYKRKRNEMERIYERLLAAKFSVQQQ